MSQSTVNNISFFNSENIAIFPEKQSIKGIFAYLKYLDGEYESRYKIEGETEYGTVSDLVMYFDTKQDHVHIKNGFYDITITFKTLLYPTHYSIVNAGLDSTGHHTYNKAWDFIGVDADNNEFVLDQQRDIAFCDDSVCSESVIKTMEIKRPKAFKKFIIRALKNSNSQPNNDYFILKAIEIFGVLCPDNSECRFIKYRTCNSNIHYINKITLQYIICLLK